VGDEDSQVPKEPRVVNKPSDERIEFIVDKHPFRFVGDHKPQFSKETRILESLCRKYFAFLNPGCSEIYKLTFSDEG
jgi:hypothetical protein